MTDNTTEKTIEETYQKKDLHQHILDRPGMYVGNTKKLIEELWIMDDNNTFVKKPVEYSPALLKIFDEVLVNALDHSVRDTTVNAIKVSVDRESGSISVWNNGSGIPIVQHKEHNVYVPELIFGNLLTSTNYDDSSQRVVGGCNGLGSKLTNIYSSFFSVETVDSQRGLRFKQDFTENMYKKSKPKVTKCSTKSFTQISFVPDWKLFDMKQLEHDTYMLFKKRVFDCIACSDKNVSIYWNNEKLKGKSFLDYVSLYCSSDSPNQSPIYDRYEETVRGNSYTWEVAVVPYEHFEQVSFVNGVNTTQGGKHVDAILYQITSKLKSVLESKKKLKDVKPSLIKDRLFFFLRATVANPSFTSQTKEYLSTPSKDFGCRIDIGEKFIDKIYKSSITDEILSFTKLKESMDLAKQTDGRKTSIVRIPKLEDALWAGTAKSNHCTLIVTEGESAKTFAMWGRAIVGPEKYGVFPLKGKILNVRDANVQQLLNNQEINNIKQILGLKQGKVYDSTQELRYGKLLILTDADVDGSHIKSLLLNLFHCWWPKLIHLNFIQTMRTPIVKAYRGSTVREFFTQQDYEHWENNDKNGNWKIKYFKGLGTSKRDDAKDCFSRFSELKVDYIYKDQECDQAILLAFEKDKNARNNTIKYTDMRKEWLTKYDRNLYIDASQKQIPIQDLIHKELIHFSNYDNLRSIPSLCDGLKPSQRKIMFYCLKKKLFQNEVKVAQLSGYVSAETSYHHGEASLQQAIIGLAQDFVGSSNNINLLLPDSNFGSRLEGGKDAASPRYIFTKFNPVTKELFHQDDLPLLTYLSEDGQSIEPEWFIPTLPTILVNGTEGIGTGYSTYIPPHNPVDIIDNIERHLSSRPLLPMKPWWRGFKGSIQETSPGTFVSYGEYKRLSDTQLSITELPIGVWVTPYKEFLESLTDEPHSKSGSKIKQSALLKDVKNKTTDENHGINFLIEFKNKKTLDTLINTDSIHKELKLTKTFNTNNMYLFDKNYHLKKYNCANSILIEFLGTRLDYYSKRKAYLLNKLSFELKLASSKHRFISEYLDDQLDINRKSKQEVITVLEQNNYEKIATSDDSVASFDYLTNLPIISFTKERITELQQLVDSLQAKITNMKSKTEKKLYIDDLSLIKTQLRHQ